MDLCIMTALKFVSSSEWLITNVAIPAYFLAVLDWKNDTISSPDLRRTGRIKQIIMAVDP